MGQAVEGDLRSHADVRDSQRETLLDHLKCAGRLSAPGYLPRPGGSPVPDRGWTEGAHRGVQHPVVGIPGRDRDSDGPTSVGKEQRGCGKVYSLQDGHWTLSIGPPSRVEVLIRLFSPWPSVTYGGCRYLRQARAETLWKYEVLPAFTRTREQQSIFDRPLQEEDKEYVLMGLTIEECEPAPDLPHEPAPTRGWAMMLGHKVPVPSFGIRATPREWVSWARAKNRQLQACVLEWILLDPTRGEEFIKRISNHPTPLQEQGQWILHIHICSHGSTRSSRTPASSLLSGEDREGEEGPGGRGEVAGGCLPPVECEGGEDRQPPHHPGPGVRR